MPSARLWTEADMAAATDRPAGQLPALVHVIDLPVSSRGGTEVLLPLGPQERLVAGALTISSSNQEEEVDHQRIQTDVTVITEAPVAEAGAPVMPQDGGKSKVSRPTGSTIGWFTVDLEDRRQLVGIYVPTTTAHPTAIGALKLGDGGPWFPATPVDTVALNERVAFPPMTTQRLMVVFGSTDTNGRFTPVSVAVKTTELAVLVAQPPSDLAVSVGRGPAFFSMPGLFPYTPGDLGDTAVGATAPGFAAAVNAARREQTEGAELPLRLAASTGGTVNLRLTKATIGAFLPDRALPPLTAPVPRDRPAQVRISVGAGRAIGALSLRLSHQPEMQQIASPPITAGARLAVVSGEGAPIHQLYQGLQADPGLALTAVEPWITVQRAGTLTLTLYTDDDGAPGLPLAAISVPVSAGDRQQVTLSLPVALLVPPRFYVGLSTLDAELWVALGSPVGSGHPLRPTQSLRRTGAGPALPFTGAMEAVLLRQSPEALPTDRLTLRRGAARIALSVDRDGRLELSQPLVGEPSLAGGGALLDALNADQADPWLTIELTSPYAGTLDLRPLRLLVGPATTAALSA